MIGLIVFILGVLVAGFGIFYLGSALSASVKDSGISQTARSEIRTGIKIGCAITILGVLILCSPSLLITVDAGNVGIQKTFGVVDSNVLQPGLSIKNPFTEVIQMSTRTMKYMDYGSSDVATITALSNDGLETTMGIAVTYHINPSKSADLYKQVGTDYTGVIMVNPIHSVPRDMISKYDTKTLYSASQEGSTDRAMLERELYDQISTRINEIGIQNSIVVEQVSIRNIDFVQTYKDSIASKMKMDTEIQQKKLEVEREKMEAERVSAQAEGIANKARIEAQGKADAARIEAQGVKDSMNTVGDQYATILFIQTMEKNPRAIYIPTNNGLPVFKNVDATATV